MKTKYPGIRLGVVYRPSTTYGPLNFCWSVYLLFWAFELPPFRFFCEESSRRPKGYGPAYCDLDRRVLVCYPRPFNTLIHVVRQHWATFLQWEWTRIVVRETATQRIKMIVRAENDALHQEALDAARLEGYQLGYQDGVRVHRAPHPLDAWEKDRVDELV
jgi:hypothetical protein